MRDAIAELRRPAARAARRDRPTTCALVTTLLDDAGINYLSVTARTKSVDVVRRQGRPQRRRPAPLHRPAGRRSPTRSGCGSSPTCATTSPRSPTCSPRRCSCSTTATWARRPRARAGGATPAGTCWSRVEGEQQPASIQVRTVLQHAWAEFEHDIRYKGSIPDEDAPDLDRRFTLAAGLLELADREFSAIRERLRSLAGARPRADRSSRPIRGSRRRCWRPTWATAIPTRAGRAPSTTRWISGLLLELGIDLARRTERRCSTRVDADAINEAMGYRYPAGAVRRLDDALLAVFGDRYLAPARATRIGWRCCRSRFERLDNGDG